MEPDPRYGQSARTTQTTRRHLEQVAAALSPLRASNNRSALANAVARLVTGVAVACRIDVFEEAEGSDLPGLVTLSRTVRMDCSSLSDPTGDLGTAEARAGQAAIVPDPARGLVWVVIPLVANRATTGALRLALAKEGDPSPAEVAYLHHIANSLAIGLSSAELHEQSERVSRRLQESLLQRELPASDWFQVAGRYLPATAGMHVGGDWYDAHLITPDELAFSVGDVAGHGVEAAARMGELRSAMRAFRLLSRAPDDLIGLLHRLCDPAGDFATALCARLGPGGGFRWASAGHLPPVLAHPTGEVERLVGHQSPPLGAGIEGVEGTVALDQHRLTPGDTVVLFTDGLIERRDEALDASLDRLEKQLSISLDPLRRPGPDEIVDGLLARRQASGPIQDDIAVIAVRLSSTG